MINPKIAAKIRALLALSEDPGATEAERLAAAFKARELLEKYQVDMGASALAEEGVERLRKLASAMDQKWSISRTLAPAIAKFTQTKCWGGGGGTEVNFLGIRSDVEFAGWLAESLANYVIGKATEFAFISSGKPWEIESFVAGALKRLTERLRGHESVANALVPVKNELIEKEFAKLGINLQRGYSRSYSATDAAAFAAGQAVGDRASFGRPVGRQGALLRLGNAK
ncbi:DUF2786 domain-containing protein [Patescibacteria group bacterium]|nr:DUF2786 domain-containing protein [Patescibacteria group bacterium]